MKELQLHQKPSIEVNSAYQQRSERKFLGSIRLHKGQKCFQFNINTAEVTEAEYECVNASMKGKVQRKLIIKPGFFYATALNVKNAERKFVQMLITNHTPKPFTLP